MTEATRAGRVATEDQEVAQAIHEAEMIAQVYKRLEASLPIDFAQEMCRLWWLKPDEDGDHHCDECDGEIA